MRWAELTAAQQNLDRQLSSLFSAGAVSTSINAPADDVVIRTAAGLTSAQLGEISTDASSSTVPVIVESSSYGSLVATTASCAFISNSIAANQLFCDPPLRGGVVIGGSVGECTAGFLVWSVSNNVPYLMTAGHCIAQDNQLWQTRFSNDSLHNIGYAHSSNWGPGDWGIIGIENPSGWDTGAGSFVWVGPSYEGLTTQNSLYPIDAAANPPFGITVCGTGGLPLPDGYSAYHTDCGTVTGTGVVALETDSAGSQATVSNLVETDVCTGKPGESGGPLYKQNYGYGILSAFYSSCDTLYYPLPAALSASNTY